MFLCCCCCVLEGEKKMFVIVSGKLKNWKDKLKILFDSEIERCAPLILFFFLVAAMNE